MNDDLQTYIEPEMEARIVALVLGEASAFETEELERLISKNPELQAYKKRLEKVHRLVGEAHAECDDSEWKLSAKRRGKVFSKIEEGKRAAELRLAKQRKKQRARRRLVYLCAACLVFSMILLVQFQTASEDKSPLLVEAVEYSAKAESDYEVRFDFAGGNNYVQPLDRVADRGSDERAMGAPAEPRQLAISGALASLDGDIQGSDLGRRSRKLESYSLESASNDRQNNNEAPALRMRRSATATSTRKPSAPRSSMSKAIAANTASPTAIPVPQLELPVPTSNFGDGDDFGDGWDNEEETEAVGNGRMAVQEKQKKGEVDVAAKKSKPQRSDSRVAANEPESMPKIEGAESVTGNLKAFTALSKAGGNFDSDTDGTGGSDFFIGGGVAGGENSNNNKVFIDAVDRVEIPGIPSPREAQQAAATPGLYDLTPDTGGDSGLPLTSTAGLSFGYSNDSAGLDGIVKRSSKSQVDVGVVDAGVSANFFDSFGGGAGDADPFAAEPESITRPVGYEALEGGTLDVLKYRVSGNERGKDGVLDRGTYFQQSAGGDPFAAESDEQESVSLYSEDGSSDLDSESRTTIAKMNQTIIPEVKLENTTLEEALEFIKLRSVELDSTTLDSGVRGFDIELKTPNVAPSESGEDGFGDAVDPSATVIKSLDLKNVPAKVALQYIADAAKMRYKVEGGKVTFLPLSESGDADIVQRRWELTPSLAESLKEATSQGKSVESIMKESGVSFMENSSVSFLADKNTLIVRNSPTNLELVDGIVSAGESYEAKKAKGRNLGWLTGKDSNLSEESAVELPSLTEGKEVDPSSADFLFGEEEVAGDLLSAADLAMMSADGERSVISKGNQILIPNVQFKKTTVEEALKFVRQRARELDNTTLDDSQKGINIVVNDPDLLKRVLPDLEFSEVPLGQLLEKIGEASGATLTIDEFSYRLSKGDVVDPFAKSDDKDFDRNLIAKLNQIILPEMTLKNTSISEALEFLRLRSVELDVTTIDDEEKGVEIVFEDADLKKEFLKRRQIVDLNLKMVPLRVAAAEIARLTGSKIRFEGKKVIFFADPSRTTDKLPEGFETSTAEKTDSTFSLNVSDVSFKLAKSSLAGGSWPDASKVRPEEFVNALDYDDTKPTQAEKVACQIEQGTHPFMQQRNLMRVAMSTASLGRNQSTPLRLTILLDQSGSMERADRVESVKRAFALLAAQLTANDEVTLIGFARTPRLLAERVKGNEAMKLAEIIANPLTEGGTNLEEALSSGLQLARQQFVKGAQNRIILLTDGAANLGDALPENLARQVESMRRSEIAFDACGVGADGLNDDVLSSLAKQGDGRYYFLDRPEDADEGFARQIAGALRPAAKNVKVQVIFNPDRVSTFKLYGYEKHKLKKEDFRNDSVDAAEMAAEESGVALYHFEPLPEGRGDIGTVSVRFLDTASNEMVERTWAIPYLPDAPLFSDAEPTLRLASVAGLFAERLKASPVGDRVDLKRLRRELQLLRPTFQNQARFNEFQTMLQQAGE